MWDSHLEYVSNYVYLHLRLYDHCHGQGDAVVRWVVVEAAWKDEDEAVLQQLQAARSDSKTEAWLAR